MSGNHPVLVLAGRRIDATGAEARFPLDQMQAVRGRLREQLQRHRPTALVCSAACGADLLALDLAAELGIRTRVVLPLPVDRFRATSVADRPGDWGGLYDRIIEAARGRGDLRVLDERAAGNHAGVDADAATDAGPFLHANDVILDWAEELAAADKAAAARVLALIVWEGQPRDDNDVTAHFRRRALARGIPTTDITTLEGLPSP